MIMHDFETEEMTLSDPGKTIQFFLNPDRAIQVNINPVLAIQEYEYSYTTLASKCFSGTSRCILDLLFQVRFNLPSYSG
jgi:hypothetical protein